jgi:hypothetical protein
MKYSISLLAFGLLLASDARATAIVAAQAVTADAGASGSFDVTLTNTGPSSIVVGAFTFGISIANPDVSFTDVTTATSSNGYIFGADSTFGPDLTGPISGPSLLVSDVYDVPFSGATIASGATVGLGQVLFTISSDSPGGAFTALLLPSPVTSLSDPTGIDIVIGTLSNGTINVQTTPECSSLFLMLGGIPLVWLKVRSRRI